MTDWNYDFFQGKTDLTEDDIEGFEAHAALVQDSILRREERELMKNPAPENICAE